MKQKDPEVMKRPQRTCCIGLRIAAFCLAVFPADATAAKKVPEPELTVQGEKLRVDYAQMLETLSAQIAAQLPKVDPQQQAAFQAARAAISALTVPKEGATPETHRAYAAMKAAVESKALDAARAILGDVGAFLTSGGLDAKLIKVAILRHGTPAGLAEFAQQGAPEKALLAKLFANEALMKQMLIAGGANGGDYGEAMQVYTAILEASEHARKPGILQRLALGTSLHMPWAPGKDKGSVNGIVYRTQTDIDQVKRYLHYEKAYLSKALDPAFKDMTTWECRFITHDPYSDEDLAWVRKMMRNYRPDHITNPDYKWRYVRLVKSDVPYCSPTNDPALGTPSQQHIALGGICGRRAYYARHVARAFGIPSRASTQTGHGAMSHWTPDGWVVCLGAWWSNAWCGPQGGLDFLLDSQAREHEQAYMQVLRAQWVGDALGEKDVSIRHYGKGGGFWDGLAFHRKRAIVEDAKIVALDLAGGMKLGESDDLLGDEKGEAIEIPEQDKKIVIDETGLITVPAAACSKPRISTERITFMQSWGGGTQVHYQRLGNRPELIRYTVEVPSAGKYQLTATVATVSDKQSVIFRLNRRTLLNVMLPYTKGMWQQSEPETIELRKGRNSIMVTFRAPNRGVSIKAFQLKPVK